MTLDELNDLNNAARKQEHEAENLKRSSALFAKLRTEGRPLYVEMTHGSGELRYREHDHSFLQGIINEYGIEILRLAELRQETKAREHQVKAAMIRKQIEAAIGKQGEAA